MTFARSLTFVYTLLFTYSYCHAHTPGAFTKESHRLISCPILSLHEECSEESSYVTQSLYGHSVHLISEAEEGWGLVEIEDGYQGYVKLEMLTLDDPRWRVSKRLVTVSSVTGCVYPIANTTKPALLRLPFGSRIELAEELYSNDHRWVQVNLADGKRAWMQRGDLEKPKIKTIEEMIALSYKFLERPYIWGGTTSEGFDCSGFIQSLYKQTGLFLPRNSIQQAASENLTVINSPELPGDILFFGTNKINHVGLYLGDEYFIHSGVSDNKSKVTITKFGETNVQLLKARRVPPLVYQATVTSIAEETAYSWQADNPVSVEELRHLKLNHWGFDGCVHQGELIVHMDIADEVVEIFGELFDNRYPIEKMLLVDAYQGDVTLSFEDNNTAAFHLRPADGSRSGGSLQSFGKTIDINPLLNPRCRREAVTPCNGRQFLNRRLDCRGMIAEGDVCYRAFISRGWQWGGAFEKKDTFKDYQRFQKEF